MKFIIACLLVMTWFLGCSSIERQGAEASPKSYSPETNRAFEMIEQGYEKPNSAMTTSSRAKATAQVEAVRSIKNEALPPQARPMQTKKPSPKLIELNQQLAFYCMKRRNDTIFKNDEKKCMDFVGKVLGQCQKKYHQAHSPLLACVKKKLKL